MLAFDPFLPDRHGLRVRPAHARRPHGTNRVPGEYRRIRDRGTGSRHGLLAEKSSGDGWLHIADPSGSGDPRRYYLREEERLILYPHATVLLFDLATGRQLPWQELLLGGWQTAGTMTAGYDGERVEAPDYGALTLCALYQGRDGALCLRFHDGGSYYTLSVPSDYIRF